MSVSKASFVFTQLKYPIRVNTLTITLTNSASVDDAIQHLLLLRLTQPEKLLALLHFLGLYLIFVLVILTFAQIFLREL